MTHHLPTWTVVPSAAIAFLVSVYAGVGVIESVTVAAFVTIGWSVLEHLSRLWVGDEGGQDGARR